MTVFIRVVAVTVGLFTLMVTTASAQAIAERICKPAVSGSATAFLQHSAKRDSVYDWREKVKALYGPAWAEYSTSKVKTFPCSREGLFTQACKVQAQPCREVGHEVASLKEQRSSE